MNIKEVQTLIKVEHLVKRYGNRNVVDDLTFTSLRQRARLR